MWAKPHSPTPLHPSLTAVLEGGVTLFHWRECCRRPGAEAGMWSDPGEILTPCVRLPPRIEQVPEHSGTHPASVRVNNQATAAADSPIPRRRVFALARRLCRSQAEPKKFHSRTTASATPRIAPIVISHGFNIRPQDSCTDWVGTRFRETPLCGLRSGVRTRSGASRTASLANRGEISFPGFGFAIALKAP